MGGRGMAPAEKAKDFKGSIKKLISYIGTLQSRHILCYDLCRGFYRI